MSVWIHGHCRNRTKYHTRECSVVEDLNATRTVTKDAAKRMGLDHCKMCQQNRKKQTQDWGYQEALLQAANE